MRRGSALISVTDYHSCDQGLKLKLVQTRSKYLVNHLNKRYALNNILFISDKSSAALALYLCE